MIETCQICSCKLHRDGEYAKPTTKGRSHATKHHYVAERFFGRSNNRRQTKREAIFNTCPWREEGGTAIFCYECHEELLHNPVFLPADVLAFFELVKARKLDETDKTEDRDKMAGRIKLLHEVIQNGLKALKAR